MSYKQDIDDILVKLKNNYSFLDLTEEEFNKITKNEVQNILTKNYQEQEKSLIVDKFKKKINKLLDKYLKEQLESEEAINVLNNFIEEKLTVHNEYNTNIDELKKIDKLYERTKSLFNIDIGIKLINNNKTISNIIKNIIDENESILKEKGIEEITDSAFVLSLIEIYCEKNNIEVKNVNDYDIENDLMYEEKDELNLPDSTRMYLNEIGSAPLLTKKEETELFHKMKSGDEQAKKTLIERNLKLVVSIAKRYTGRGMAFLDLVQEGNLGLMVAIDKFEPELGWKLSTYATWWIKQRIERAICEKSRNIRMPVHLYEKMTVYARAYDKLKEKNFGNPTVEELALELNWNEEKIKKIQTLRKDTISIHKNVGDEDAELGDFIPDKNQSIESEVLEKQFQKEIIDLFDKCKLKDHEIEILIYHWGLFDVPPLNLENIGNIYGITRERVRQIEASAIKKIRRSKYIKGMAIYMDNPTEAIKNIDDFRSDSLHKFALGNDFQKKYVIKKYTDDDLKNIRSMVSSIMKSIRNISETKELDTKNIEQKQPKKINEIKQKMTKKIKIEKKKINKKEMEIETMAKEKGKRRDGSTVYKYYYEYTEEQIDDALSKLPEKDIENLNKRYGEDLKNPTLKKLSKEEHSQFFTSMERLRSLLDGKKLRTPKTKTKNAIEASLQKPKMEEKEVDAEIIEEPVIEETLVTEEINNKEQNDIELVTENKNDVITSEEYINILEIFNRPEFIELLKSYSLKESLIIALKSGFIDGKYYSTEAIANFLGMEKYEVTEIAKLGFSSFRNKLNEMIDEAEKMALNENFQYKLKK